MSAHRYWRVRFTDSSAYNAIRIAEIEFLATGTGAVIAPVAHASSSDQGASYKVANLFDGNKTSTDWFSTSSNCWASADFGAPVDIEAALIYNTKASGSDGVMPIPGAMLLEYSDNNTDWTEESRDAIGMTLPGEIIRIGFNRQPPLNVQARYWKLSEIDTNSKSLKVSKLQLWNDSARVCQAATLTASFAPETGAVDTLKDDTDTTCVYNYATKLRFPDFIWDAGAGNTLDVLLLRTAGPDFDSYIRNYVISYSTDGNNWTVYQDRRRTAIAFAGTHVLSEKADAGKLFPPRIDPWSRLGPGSVDPVENTVNFNDNSIPQRVVIPISDFGRMHFEVQVPIDNTFTWSFSVCLPELDVPNGNGLAGAGHSNGCWFNYSTVYYYLFANEYVYGGQKIRQGFRDNGYIGVSIDNILGYITFSTTSGRVTFRSNYFKSDRLFFHCGKTRSGETDAPLIKDRIFRFNFGSSPFTLPVPNGYLPCFGTKQRLLDSMFNSSDTNGFTGMVISQSPNEAEPFDNLTMLTEPSRFGRYEQYTGRGYIKNKVYTKGTPNIPVRKRIALFDLATNICVAETVSDANGLFEFKFLDEKLKYVAMALDELGQWEPACTGPLTPSIMPLVTT